MRLSFIVAYYNRPEALAKTLEAYSRLDLDAEFIIIDDGSDIPPFEFPELDTTYRYIDVPGSNPCLPFNVAAKMARGDVLTLTNPECLPLTQMRSLGTHEGYAVAQCYSEPEGGLRDMPNRPARFDGDEGWYVHPQFNARPFHFLATIPKDLYFEIGGFDEDFRLGVAWEDEDLVRRIKLKGIPITFMDETVLHQWHYSRPGQRGEQNQALCEQKAREGKWQANSDRKWGVV